MSDTDQSFEKLMAPQAEPRSYSLSYINVITFTYFHSTGLYGLYLCFTEARWSTIFLALFLHEVAMVGTTAGAHRLWAHRAYKANLPLQILLMIFQSVACQNTVIHWATDHRLHHKYTDTDPDPHNATRGFFFSHVGWLLVKKHPEARKRLRTIDISDLLQNPVLKFQKNCRKLIKIEWLASATASNVIRAFRFVPEPGGSDRMTAFKKVGLEAVKQGGITAIWFMDKLYLVLADPQAADIILKTCLEKDQQTMQITRLMTGDGLIFAPVNIWRSRRKIAAPTFSMKYLNSFVQVFARQSAVMMEQLQPVADGRDFSIWKYLTTYTFDAVCETNLGIQINAQKTDHHPFLDAFDSACKEGARRVMMPWLHNDAVYSLLPQAKRLSADILFIHNFVDKIICAKKLELAQTKTSNVTSDTVANKSVMKTFLDLLIEASGGSQGYDDVELREEVLVVLLAGTDTSAVGASYAALMLSRYPEEQAKVYEEIQQVFGDSDRPLEADDLPKLKYLEVFLKETLRMYPPVPITTRAVHSDFMLPSGKTLVAGTRILLNIWAMHRNQQYWGEDADQFRPERFLQPLRHPAQFIPFSYGMRNCLGYQYAMMSMKTVVASLVRRYRLLPPAGLSRDQLRQELRVEFDFMMKHVDNYVLRLEPRN